MRILNFAILLTFCIVGISQLAPSLVQSQELKTSLVFPLNDQHNHAPGIVELPDRSILVSWYRGSGERKADDVVVLGSRKPFDSDNWSDPFLMVDTPGFPDCNTCMMVDSQEQLWLYWPIILANTWDSAITHYVVSDDYLGMGTPVWKKKESILLKPNDFSQIANEKLDAFLRESKAELTDSQLRVIQEIREKLSDRLFQRLGWQCRCKPAVLRSGKILLPLYSDTYSFSLMAISDDGGNTWHASEPLIGFGNIQPTVFERNDGSIVALMRENGITERIRACESRDGGETWGDVYSTGLANPGSGLDGVRLANGNWVLIYNDTADKRHRLAVSLSDDEGKTWKWTRHLEDEPGNSYHYPAIIQGRDGTIHAIYSYFVAGGKSMKYASFPESWIQQP